MYCIENCERDIDGGIKQQRNISSDQLPYKQELIPDTAQHCKKIRESVIRRIQIDHRCFPAITVIHALSKVEFEYSFGEVRDKGMPAEAEVILENQNASRLFGEPASELEKVSQAAAIRRFSGARRAYDYLPECHNSPIPEHAPLFSVLRLPDLESLSSSPIPRPDSVRPPIQDPFLLYVFPDSGR